ncbi:OprO/OprP family phosphate-selective porin [Capnocytophaga catalasegens]|uniref:Porin n=1 Tax=Capnocytophaga catalasegens TaxID=1004260 RepID=A0AAV5AWG1_9FLAO|nr:OprO/OprP family phosphate-selective porin [Capnocytophaga catalasegens]GIZ15386.1 porin [Capnocytophaga catalasegens]GJM50974.1 porin [Capnocytophaga catalasegens]GJM52158.1 porin [Capnocytophaga catalasegens]
MKRLLLSILFILIKSWNGYSQQEISGEEKTNELTPSAISTELNSFSPPHEEKLEIKPLGRILLDAGIFYANEYKDKFVSGVAIPDVRTGMGIYYGKWKGKIDIAYAYGKITPKDIFLEYKFNKQNLLRGGFFVHQFGLQSSTSSSFKVSMEEPQSNQAFFNSRLLGLMFVHNKDNFFGTLSIFAENETIQSSSDKIGNEGYGMMSRLLYRPLREKGNILHIGISGSFESPRYNSDPSINHSFFRLKTNFPTRIARVTAQSAEIIDAKMLYKCTPELVFAKNKLGFETQYYYLTINRKNGATNYQASGFYTLVRGLIRGDSYTYSENDGGIKLPSSGSLELVFDYNYTDLSDHKINILGGRLNDFSLVFNYYINKYMIWRVRGSYTTVTDRANFLNTNVSLIETRLQFKF